MGTQRVKMGKLQTMEVDELHALSLAFISNNLGDGSPYSVRVH